MLFGESIRYLLLFAHGLATFALVGSAGHALVTAISEWRGGQRGVHRRVLLANVLLVAFVVTFLTGVWLYPHFRVAVRAACFDDHFPALTGLFEIKEHWLAITFGLLITHRALAFEPRPSRPRAAVAILIGLAVLASTFIGVAVVAGDLCLCPEVLP